MTSEWDKTFPKSEKVNHRKVTFPNRYGIILAADLYEPKGAEGKLAAIAVCGPFGAVKEQAAVDFLSVQENVDPERIGIIGICGWGGLALNAAAIDTRIKATVASTMYDMTRVNANGYFDAEDSADAPFFVADYHDYYKTGRGYHKRSLNSNDGWNVIGCMSFMNQPILQYSNEIRSAVLIMHGEKAHSCYFSRDAYDAMVKDNPYTENKELLIIPDAVHTDLYDGGKDAIPFDKLEQFFGNYLG